MGVPKGWKSSQTDWSNLSIESDDEAPPLAIDTLGSDGSSSSALPTPALPKECTDCHEPLPTGYVAKQCRKCQSRDYFYPEQAATRRKKLEEGPSRPPGFKPMMPRPEPRVLRAKLLEAAQEDNYKKALERAAATRRAQGLLPLEWNQLSVTERVAALGMAHLDHFNAAADNARRLQQERVAYRKKLDDEDMASTLVQPSDNMRRGEFLTEEEYSAYMLRLGAAKRQEADGGTTRGKHRR